MNLARRISDWWFPNHSTFGLAVCRIAFAVAALFFSDNGWQVHAYLLDSFDAWPQPLPFVELLAAILGEDRLRDPQVFWSIYQLKWIFGAMVIMGVLSRPSSFCFAFLFTFTMSHQWSYGELHHSGVIAIFLWSLAFSDCGESLSIDAIVHAWHSGDGDWLGLRRATRNALWPLRLFQVVLGLTYMNAAWCKLRDGGLAWLNGYTLQNHLFRVAELNQIPISIWLARQHYLCALLSQITLVWEFLFLPSLFSRRGRNLVVVLGVCVHVGMFVLMDTRHYGWLLAYSVFLPFDRILALCSAGNDRLRGSVLRSASQTHNSETHVSERGEGLRT